VKLNSAQIQVLAVGGCFLLFACVIVPWYLPATVNPNIPYSVTLRSFGFAPIFAPPLAGAAVDTGRLTLEVLMILAVTGCFTMFAYGDNAKDLKINIALIEAGALFLLACAIVYSTSQQVHPMPVPNAHGESVSAETRR
jgi:hypothetical protein